MIDIPESGIDMFQLLELQLKERIIPESMKDDIRELLRDAGMTFSDKPVAHILIAINCVLSSVLSTVERPDALLGLAESYQSLVEQLKMRATELEHPNGAH